MCGGRGRTNERGGGICRVSAARKRQWVCSGRALIAGATLVVAPFAFYRSNQWHAVPKPGATTKLALAPCSALTTGWLRSPPAFGALISRLSIEHFLKLPRFDGRKHPADEFRWNRRQPFGIDEIAFDEVGGSAKPVGGGEQPGVNQRRSTDDNDPAIAK